MRPMRAAVLHAYEQPLAIEEISVEAPHAGEVLIRLAASGVCRSDLHVQHGRSPVARLPMVLGHEGAGVVIEVGSGVAGLAVGDPVVIALYGPCGDCGDCRAGRLERCASETRRNNMFGLMPDGSTRLSLAGRPVHPMVGAGTLAEYSLVRDAQAVAIPPDLPLDLACLIGCGVTTGVGAVLNVARVAAGASVAVIGCGGVGLCVVQAARIAGAARIVAVDTQASKLDLASDLGATHLAPIEPGESAAEAIRAHISGGVDYAFEVVGSPTLVREALLATRPGGMAVMIGAPPEGAELTLDARQIFSDRTLVGTLGGGNVPMRDIPRIVELWRSGRLQLDKLVSQRLPLERVNEAFAALEQGRLARSVVLL
jgi:S-(hydroxymethyl)glutathione dehydrogenase/alcohol dehydrogenase